MVSFFSADLQHLSELWLTVLVKSGAGHPTMEVTREGSGRLLAFLVHGLVGFTVPIPALAFGGCFGRVLRYARRPPEKRGVEGPSSHEFDLARG